MDKIVYENPPPRQVGRVGFWKEHLLPLVENPGKWARVRTSPSLQSARQTAFNLAAGRLKAPPGRWEFRAATVGEDHVLFARYLGPEE